MLADKHKPAVPPELAVVPPSEPPILNQREGEAVAEPARRSLRRPAAGPSHRSRTGPTDAPDRTRNACLQPTADSLKQIVHHRRNVERVGSAAEGIN